MYAEISAGIGLLAKKYPWGIYDQYLSTSVSSGVGQDVGLLALEVQARVGRLGWTGWSGVGFSASVDEDLAGLRIDLEFLGPEAPEVVLDLAEAAGIGVGGRYLTWKPETDPISRIRTWNFEPCSIADLCVMTEYLSQQG